MKNNLYRDPITGKISVNRRSGSDRRSRVSIFPLTYWGPLRRRKGGRRPGDIGYVDDEGYVYLVDRKQDMIITGGYNVYAIEVENCLNSHPAIQNSAVVGIPHESWGEAVCAMVLPTHGCRPSSQELKDHCKRSLARYKVPKNIEITGQLPLSPAGKVLRREVRRWLKLKCQNDST